MSARGRSTDLRILAAAGGATVALTALSFFAAPVDVSPIVDGSSYAAHPQGARGAYLALKAAGYRVERTFEPLAAIERQPPDAILVLAAPQTPPSRQDLRALERFVSRGGIVLAAGAESVAFLPGSPFRPGGGRVVAGSSATASMLSPFSRYVPEVRMAPPARSLAEDAPYVPVYGDERTPYVLAARVGEGRVLWWSDAWPLSNGGIARAGHAELLANALGPPSDGRLVLWDEHYHGYTRSLWSYLAGTPVPHAVLQLGLVFAAFVFAFSRRRAPVRVPRVEARTSPLEFVESLGALYERAGASAGVVGTVRARVRRALVTATGLPPSASDERLSRAAAERTGMDAVELRDLLARSAEAARASRISADTARALVSELQEVASRLRAVTPQRSPRAGRV